MVGATLAEHLKRAIPLLPIIRRLPGPFKLKVAAITGKVLPSGLHAAAAVPVPVKYLRQLTSGIVDILGCDHGGNRSVDLMLALACDLNVDPLAYILYQRLWHFRDLAAAAGPLRSRVERTLRLLAAAFREGDDPDEHEGMLGPDLETLRRTARQPHGPVGLLVMLLGQFDCSIDESWILHGHIGGPVCLWDIKGACTAMGPWRGGPAPIPAGSQRAYAAPAAPSDRLRWPAP